MWPQGQESGVRVERTAPDAASGRHHPRKDQASQHEVQAVGARPGAPRRTPRGGGSGWPQGQESGVRVFWTAPDAASGRPHPRKDQASQHEVQDAGAGPVAPRRTPEGGGAASATGAAPAATGQEDPTSRGETRRRRLSTRTAHVCRGASNMGGEPCTASPGGPRWKEPVEEGRCATACGAGCAAARSGREDLPMEERLREELLPKTEDQQEPYEAAAAYYCQVGKGRPGTRVGRSRPGACAGAGVRHQ